MGITTVYNVRSLSNKLHINALKWRARNKEERLKTHVLSQRLIHLGVNGDFILYSNEDQTAGFYFVCMWMTRPHLAFVRTQTHKVKLSIWPEHTHTLQGCCTSSSLEIDEMIICAKQSPLYLKANLLKPMKVSKILVQSG